MYQRPARRLALLLRPDAVICSSFMSRIGDMWLTQCYMRGVLHVGTYERYNQFKIRPKLSSIRSVDESYDTVPPPTPTATLTLTISDRNWENEYQAKRFQKYALQMCDRLDVPGLGALKTELLQLGNWESRNEN